MAITLTLKKAAQESVLSIRTLYHAIGSGELSSVKVGRRRLIPVRALEQFLLKGRCGPKEVRSAVGTDASRSSGLGSVTVNPQTFREFVEQGSLRNPAKTR